MKTIIKNMIWVSLLGSLALAEVSIDEQIQEIQNAPATERVEMMNALKVRISNMNSEERIEAVLQLRTQMRAGQANEKGEHSQSTQDANMIQMQNMERMKQKDVGEQYIQHDIDSGSGGFGGTGGTGGSGGTNGNHR